MFSQTCERTESGSRRLGLHGACLSLVVPVTGGPHMPKLYLATLDLAHGVGFYAARAPGKQGNKTTTVLVCREQKVKPRKTSNIITFLKWNSSTKHCELLLSQSVLAVVSLECYYLWLSGDESCSKGTFFFLL